MAKLNQIIAIEKGIKGNTHTNFSEIYKAVQKPALFNGFFKSYQKKNEESEDLPSETQRVQITVKEALSGVARVLTEFFDVTARKDYTNCVAKADVVVDGKVIVAGAPVSNLLFLEKQLTDVRTFLGHLPVLDPSESWTLDPNSGLYKTDAIQTHRTKKIQRAIVLYNATPEHPAQTQLITEDVLAGYWNQIKQSGAIPATDRAKLLERVEVLLQAVKQAREEANGFEEVAAPSVGESVFDFLLQD